MLEVASHLVARPAWSYRQVQIHLREQGPLHPAAERYWKERGYIS